MSDSNQSASCADDFEDASATGTEDKSAEAGASDASPSWVELMGREVRYRVLQRPQPLAEMGSMGTIVTCRLWTYYILPPSSQQEVRPEEEGGAATPSGSGQLEGASGHRYIYAAGDSDAERDENSVGRRVIVEQSDFEQFKIGEGDAVPGLELCLRHSKPGDVLRVRCSARFAWGMQGRSSASTGIGSGNRSSSGSAARQDGGAPPSAGGLDAVAIPAGAEVEFEAEVLSHSPDVLDPKLAAEVSQAAPVLTVVAADSVANSSGKNYDTAGTQAVAAPASVLMSPEELVHYVDVQLRRTSGNRWYRWGDLARAGRCYSKAAEAAEKMIFPPQPDAAAIVQSRGQVLQEAPKERKVSRRWLDLYVASINNLAATHLQSGDALKAREACIKGLEVAPFNVTTLLRAGRASLQLHEYDEASLCFKRVLEIDPSNKAVGTDIAKLRRAVEQYKASRKAMSSRMVSKLFASSKGGQGLPGGGNSAPKECADEYEIVVKNNGTDTKEGSSVGDGSICGTGTEANAHSGAIDGSSTIEDFCPAVSEASGSQSASEELLLPRSPRSVASAAAAPSTGRKAATATEAHREPVQDGVKGESSGTGSDSSLIAVPELRRLVVLAAGVLGFAVGMAVLRM